MFRNHYPCKTRFVFPLVINDNNVKHPYDYLQSYERKEEITMYMGEIKTLWKGLSNIRSHPIWMDSLITNEKYIYKS
jgi:hypothetical protein